MVAMKRRMTALAVAMDMNMGALSAFSVVSGNGGVSPALMSLIINSNDWSSSSVTWGVSSTIVVW